MWNLLHIEPYISTDLIIKDESTSDGPVNGNGKSGSVPRVMGVDRLFSLVFC